MDVTKCSRGNSSFHRSSEDSWDKIAVKKSRGAIYSISISCGGLETYSWAKEWGERGGVVVVVVVVTSPLEYKAAKGLRC